MSSEAELVETVIASTAELEQVRATIRGHEEQVRAGRAKLQAARLARAQAIWDLYHEQGLSHEQIEAVLAAGFREHGMGAGLSHDTIRLVAGSKANPKPRPE